MEDLGIKTLLLFIGAFATLIVNEARRQFSRGTHVVTWSLAEDQLVVAREALPPAIRQFLPQDQTMNVSRFVVAARNTGGRAVEDAVVLVVLRDGARLLTVSTRTVPPRAVPVTEEDTDEPQEFGYTVSLQRDQEFVIEFLARSTDKPAVDVYWRGGEDDQEFRRADAELVDTAEQHLLRLLRNVVLAWAVPPAINGVALLLGPGARGFFFGDVYPVAGGVGVILSAMVQLYFYLRAVPHGLALFHLLSEQRRYPAAGTNSVVIVDSAVHTEGGVIGGYVERPEEAQGASGILAPVAETPKQEMLEQRGPTPPES